MTPTVLHLFSGLGSSGMAYMALTRVQFVSGEQAERILAEDNYWKDRGRR